MSWYACAMTGTSRVTSLPTPYHTHCSLPLSFWQRKGSRLRLWAPPCLVCACQKDSPFSLCILVPACIAGVVSWTSFIGTAAPLSVTCKSWKLIGFSLDVQLKSFIVKAMQLYMWKSHIVAIFLLFLTIQHVLTYEHTNATLVSTDNLI